MPSKEWFEDWKRQQVAGGLTDIHRAARYYYVQQLCFGGRVFVTAPMHHPRINLLRMEEELSAVHLRLVGVTIEHLSWEEFIRRYDKPGTLFYCDQPYYKAPFYEHNLALSDYQQMASMLAETRSRFILSINDHPEIREVFRAFEIYGVYGKADHGQGVTDFKLMLKKNHVSFNLLQLRPFFKKASAVPKVSQRKKIMK